MVNLFSRPGPVKKNCRNVDTVLYMLNGDRTQTDLLRIDCRIVETVRVAWSAFFPDWGLSKKICRNVDTVLYMLNGYRTQADLFRIDCRIVKIVRVGW